MSGGCIVYASINDFFGEYLRDCVDKLGDFEIIVCSRSIIASVKKQDQNSGTALYESKYKNVTFLRELTPNPSVLEYATSSSNDAYRNAYMDQLSTVECMNDICCMIDLVVNDNKNIFILCANSEYIRNDMEILEEFIMLNFKFRIYSYADMMSDPDIVYKYGNVDEVKLTLAYQMERLGLVDDTLGQFFNKLYADMQETYRNVLLSKTKEELAQLAMRKGIYINKHRPIEKIVDHIMEKIIES